MRQIGHIGFAALALLPLASCASVDQRSATCSPWDKLARPMMPTHTLIPYPPISSRLNEQGVTVMTVAIGIDGVPIDVKVEQTSGSDRLDAAAVLYIKAHWRWQPPKEGCGPATAAVNVAWHISKSPAPTSGLTMQRGLETMTIYTSRINQMS
jgi:TonB family protein